MADIEEIIGNFVGLDDRDDRYRYLIELGRELPPFWPAVTRWCGLMQCSKIN
jgi:cysteine desulfuration protein SufE